MYLTQKARHWFRVSMSKVEAKVSQDKGAPLRVSYPSNHTSNRYVTMMCVI